MHVLVFVSKKRKREKVTNPVRFLNLVLVAVRAISAIKKIGGEEGFKFFLNLVNLQPATAISAPIKSVVVAPVVAEQQVVSTVSAPKPGTILMAPASTPGKPLPPDRLERMMRGEAPKPLASNDFAAKLNGAAKELGFEDKSVLGRFRKVLNDLSGKGLDYWNLCREVVEDALRGADPMDSDWNLLVDKMKHNLFFTGRKAALFIDRCPKEKLSQLLLDQDGLTGLVARIRTEEYESESSVYRIAFILDAGKKVGSDAKVLVENCKHAVNRMRQRGFIPADHWLIEEVRDFNRPKLPEKLFASSESIAILAEVPLGIPPAPTTDVGVPEIQKDPDAMTEAELERLTAPEPINGDGKPKKLDPLYAAQFAAAMGESSSVQ